jgi:hypothetical protein
MSGVRFRLLVFRLGPTNPFLLVFGDSELFTIFPNVSIYGVSCIPKSSMLQVAMFSMFYTNSLLDVTIASKFFFVSTYSRQNELATTDVVRFI